MLMFMFTACKITIFIWNKNKQSVKSGKNTRILPNQ